MSLAPDLDVLPTGHSVDDTQKYVASGDLSAADGQAHYDTQGRAAVGSDSPPDGAIDGATPIRSSLRPEDALLAIYADALDDFERVRVATDNRLWALAKAKGMDDTPEAERMRATSEALAALEHGVELELKRAMRAHPLGPWVKRTVGVGEKQAARLLASLGPLEHRRSPAQVWAYCGWVPGRKRQKGVKANWNAKARSRSWLIAESITKQTCPSCRRESAVKKANNDVRWTPPPDDCTCAEVSPYRHLYDQYRIDHDDATHDEPCPRCGPKGSSAPVGSPLSPGHKKARAIRYVAKRILRDMWREAKEVSR